MTSSPSATSPCTTTPSTSTPLPPHPRNTAGVQKGPSCVKAPTLAVLPAAADRPDPHYSPQPPIPPDPLAPPNPAPWEASPPPATASASLPSSSPPRSSYDLYALPDARSKHSRCSLPSASARAPPSSERESDRWPRCLPQ